MGITMALLNESGTVPSDKHKLTNLATAGVTVSIVFDQESGIGPRLHDLVGDLNIITDLSETGKQVKLTQVVSGDSAA